MTVPRKPAWLLAALALALAIAAPASAAAKDAKPVVTKAAARTHIDWSRGLVVASAGQAADLRAPRPEIARIAAERKARDRAREAVLAAARKVVLATGKRVGEVLGGDPQAETRFSQLAASIHDLEVSYASDGSATVTVGLPLEAVRRAVMGTDEAPAADEAAPTAIIVDARKVLRAPRLGVAIARGDASYRGPVVFYRGGLDTGDDRLGPRVAIARAARYHHGTLLIKRPLRALPKATEKTPPSLEAAASSGALVVVILGDER